MKVVSMAVDRVDLNLQMFLPKWNFWVLLLAGRPSCSLTNKAPNWFVTTVMR